VELFAKGKERLYFVNSKIDEREFVAKELDGGYLIKNRSFDNIIRYEPKPKYPVIGEKSRKQRANALLDEIKQLEVKITKIGEELHSTSQIIRDLQELEHIFSYLEMNNLEVEVEEKKRFIELIEEKSFIYNKIKDYLTNIRRLKSYFERKDYVEHYEKVTYRSKEIKKELETINNKDKSS